MSFIKNHTPVYLPVTRIIVLALLSHISLAQFTENFTDGDFTANPTWSGDGLKFTVQSEQLRLLAPAVSDVAYLSTPSIAIENATWEFYIRLDFDPSGSNYADVYLASENSILTGPLSGYFVRVGNTGDEISLYRQNGNTKTKIIDGIDGRVTASSVQVKVRATHDSSGNWELFSDVGISGAFVSEGTAADPVKLSSGYMGIVCVYTSTRSSHFYFDDFVVTGDPYIDPSTPADFKDVILTEIFADPTPTIGLPDAEFIELYNRSSKIINLDGWKFTDGSSTAILPGLLLQPNHFLILTASASATLFNTFGSAMGVSNFPTLNNAGDNLILRRKDDLLIDQVIYSDSWYKDDDKKLGGYTLELIDPSNPCGEGDNWIAADAGIGGTPGAQNSVFANKPDLTGPKLIAAIPVSSTEIIVKFNEKLSDQLPNVSDFTIVPSVVIVQISFPNASLKSIKLTLSGTIQPGIQYSITAQNVYDCNSNVIQSNLDAIIFGLPETAEVLDVVINEILFNPRPTGVDFIEVYNTSSKFINIKNWTIANFQDETLMNPKLITTDDFLIGPGAYLVFTENSNILKGEYLSSVEKNFYQVIDLPGFNDTDGTVTLVDAQNNRIDFFSYVDDYHSVFLSDDEGVSLERISSSALTNEAANWKSASSTSGFATPGYVNSNVNSGQTSGKITVTPEIFEPVTGLPNFTQIHYNFEQGGLVANVKILDFQGREILQIANNATLGTSGFFRWDGETKEGTKARVGYYVVWVEVFSASGKVETFRKRVVVAAKL